MAMSVDCEEQRRFEIQVGERVQQRHEWIQTQTRCIQLEQLIVSSFAIAMSLDKASNVTEIRRRSPKLERGSELAWRIVPWGGKRTRGTRWSLGVGTDVCWQLPQRRLRG